MAHFTVNGSGSFSSLAAAIADAGTQNGDLIEAVGPWSTPDQNDVVWNKSVQVRMDAASRHPGRTWEAGDTHYALQGSGVSGQHVIVASADVDIENTDIRGTSTGLSDEVIRTTSPINVKLTNCLVGFNVSTNQQDAVYSSWDGGTGNTWEFIQCQFYKIGRSIVGLQGSSSDYTVNFNSCGGFNLGQFSPLGNGAWFGHAGGASGNTYTVNTQNSNIYVNTESGNRAFGMDAFGNTFVVNTDNSLYNWSDTALVSGTANADNRSNMQYNVPWVEGDPDPGQLGVISLSGNYDLRLFDDSSDNIAQDSHSVATGPNSGLTIPAFDYLGTARPFNTDYDTGPHEIGAAGPAPLPLDVDDSQHAHQSEAPTLSIEPPIPITIQDAQHAHQSEAPEIGGTFEAAPEDSQHVHQSEAPTLGQINIHPISIQDCQHAQPAQAVLLGADWSLEVQDAQHAQQSEAPALVPGLSLDVADSQHAQQAEDAPLGGILEIASADCQHLHISQEVTLGAAGEIPLVAESSFHAHQSEAPEVATSFAIQVQDSQHVQSAETADVEPIWQLQGADSQHGQTSDSNDIGFILELDPQDCQHVQQADAPTLDSVPAGTVPLIIEASQHGHIAQAPEIQTIFGLDVADSQHAVTDPGAPVDSGLTLTPQDLNAIAQAVYDKLVSEGLVAQMLEVWQRRGLDAVNPQTFRKAGPIEVAGITIQQTTNAQGDVTQTRQ